MTGTYRREQRFFLTNLWFKTKNIGRPIRTGAGNSSRGRFQGFAVLGISLLAMDYGEGQRNCPWGGQRQHCLGLTAASFTTVRTYFIILTTGMVIPVYSSTLYLGRRGSLLWPSHFRRPHMSQNTHVLKIYLLNKIYLSNIGTSVCQCSTFTRIACSPNTCSQDQHHSGKPFCPLSLSRRCPSPSAMKVCGLYLCWYQRQMIMQSMRKICVVGVLSLEKRQVN